MAMQLFGDDGVNLFELVSALVAGEVIVSLLF
jgi:hypothetical protein